MLLLGYKVMETMGKKVVKLDYAKGFSAQFATAVAVNCGSIMGLPLSTTHCMVGSLCGLIIARKAFKAVKDIYPDEREQPDSVRNTGSTIEPAYNEMNKVDTPN